MQQATPTTFPSKRDAWITLVIWVGAILAVIGGMSQTTSTATPSLRLLVLIGLVAGAALMLWVLYGTAYTITSDRLEARRGPFRFRVPLLEIDSVEPSRNPLSSPACSLDRLDIRYRHARRHILVSPRDKVAFTRALLRACPHSSLQGDRIVRNVAA